MPQRFSSIEIIIHCRAKFIRECFQLIHQLALAQALGSAYSIKRRNFIDVFQQRIEPIKPRLCLGQVLLRIVNRASVVIGKQKQAQHLRVVSFKNLPDGEKVFERL